MPDIDSYSGNVFARVNMVDAMHSPTVDYHPYGQAQHAVMQRSVPADLESLSLALELEPADHSDMQARLVKFGEIEVEGKPYMHDVVIDGGKVRKRKKGPSKQFRGKFGHTPLSAEEEIPWGGNRLMVGTGAHGLLPVMDEVLAEAKRRGIEVIAAPTLQICQLLEDVKRGQAYAILHCTC
jgi:hypothetical protein